VQEAQNAVATRALYALLQDDAAIPASLPPSFQKLWYSWDGAIYDQWHKLMCLELQFCILDT